MKSLFVVSALLAVATALPHARNSGISCNTGNIGRLFTHSNPSMYWVCEWAGQGPRAMPCAPGTVFVERLQTCDHANTGTGDPTICPPCDSATTTTPCPPCDSPTTTTPCPPCIQVTTTTTTPCPPCTTTTTPCPPCNEVTTCPPCDGNGTGDPTVCVDGAFICDSSRMNRLWANSRDARSYFACPWEGMCAVLMPCAPGTVWNQNLQVCDWP